MHTDSTTLVPASFDAPTFRAVVRDGEGRRDFGRVLDLSDVGDADLDLFEAETLLVEAHVAHEIAAMRRMLAAERRVRVAALDHGEPR